MVLLKIKQHKKPKSIEKIWLLELLNWKAFLIHWISVETNQKVDIPHRLCFIQIDKMMLKGHEKFICTSTMVFVIGTKFRHSNFDIKETLFIQFFLSPSSIVILQKIVSISCW
jgi:hypothetical protein